SLHACLHSFPTRRSSDLDSYGFGIQALVNRNKQAQTHTGSDDLGHLHAHHVGQVVGGYKFGNLQHLRHHLLFHGCLFRRMGDIVALLAAEFSALSEFTGFARTAKTRKRGLDLVLDFLFGWFLTAFCTVAGFPPEIRTSFRATLVGSTMCSGALRRLIFTFPFAFLVVSRSTSSTGRRDGLFPWLKFR